MATMGSPPLWMHRSRTALVRRCRRLVGIEDVPRSAHGLQIDRRGRVSLDLAAKTVDLHVYRPRAAVSAVPRKFRPGYGFSGAAGKQPQEFAFARCQAHGDAVAPQLAAFDMKRACPHRDFGCGG